VLPSSAALGIAFHGRQKSKWYLSWGSHILASTVKRYDRAVELAVRWFMQGTLPQGDVLLGLDDDAVGISGISPAVPAAVRKKLAHIAAAIRASEAAAARS
jgi:basic membrane lipoprotein Med (substrate-binding protein (PBP1-ABC) superfamily)